MDKKLLIPGIFGNLLEWYDFALYGYFAPIIGHLFFPMHSKFSSLLVTFGVFAIGFFMRPLGAILFGHYGDRLGRKKTLAAGIILMALPTTLIGLLPTYEQIGFMSGVLLTLCRLLQGLAIGGEFGGSITYIIEHAPPKQRGLYGSWVMFSAFAGLLVGSATGALMGLWMPQSVLQTWGWRLPFIAGFLLGFIGLYLRLYMPESPFFLEAKAERRLVKTPLLTAIKTCWRNMLIALGLDFLPAMGFYLLFVYLSSYMVTYLKVPLEKALTCNTLSMIVIIIFIPFTGWLSDKIGRKPVLMIGAISYLIFSYPLFILLQQADFNAIWLAQSCFALIVCFAYGTIPATFVELMPTAVRYTAMSLPYNLANALFGGTAPLVATYLIGKTNNLLAPGFYLMLGAIIMLISLGFLKESYKKTLD